MGGQQRGQALAFGCERLADDPLQSRVARPLDLVLTQVGGELGDDEAGRDVAARDLFGLLDEVFDELAGPQAVAEMLGDERALRVVLVPRDGVWFEGLTGEVAAEDEGEIVGHILPGEAEEGLLGLEVADLQHAPDLVVQAGAGAGQGQLRLGEAQVFQPLRVVEIRVSVQGILFGR